MCSSCGSDHASCPGRVQVLISCRARPAPVQPLLRQRLSQAPAAIALRAQPLPKAFDTAGMASCRCVCSCPSAPGLGLLPVMELGHEATTEWGEGSKDALRVC